MEDNKKSKFETIGTYLIGSIAAVIMCILNRYIAHTKYESVFMGFIIGLAAGFIGYEIYSRYRKNSVKKDVGQD